MRVVLSTIGKFQTFDLGRQLHGRGALTAVFTGYPRFKLHNEGLPADMIRSFPWIQTLYMAKGRFGLKSLWLDRQMAWWAHEAHDKYCASHLPPCDVYIALSGVGLRAGRIAQKRGGVFICDRPCSHIRYQDTIMRDEYARHGQQFHGYDPRIMAREEQEYAEANAIAVPSVFARSTFIGMGVPPAKVHLVPWGVDLSRFHPVGSPDLDRFDVLFVGGPSLRKGIPYLLESFAALDHPRKHLRIVGTPQVETEALIAQYAARLPITCTGHCPQPELKEIMSRSHVMVLPSVEDGFGMVLAEAMACGCPVIGTPHTGAPDLITDGEEGFLVPIRDSEALTDRLQTLADHPDLQARLSGAALRRVQKLGGWDGYGDSILRLCETLTVSRELSNVGAA